MKRTKIWTCNIENKKTFYIQKEGYYIDDGLLAVTREKNRWAVTHVPTGYAVYLGIEKYSDATAGAKRLRTLNQLNWYSTWPDEICPEELKEYKPLIDKVFDGGMTNEEFCAQIMKDKMEGR